MMNLSWKGAPKEDLEERNRMSSYRGYLLKMRRSHNMLAPQWGKRWFSIEGRFLRWYRQESDVSSSGMIDLRNVRSITKIDMYGTGGFTFCVTNEDRNLVLRASANVELNGWVRNLHMHADIARGGTGMNVVSDFNEVPLRSQGMLQSKRGKAVRTSLTLNHELEKNLRKLNDLELDLLSQSESATTLPISSLSLHVNPEGKSGDDEFDTCTQESQDTLQDSTNYDPTLDPIVNTNARAGAKAVPLGSLLRTDSADSIESINLGTQKVVDKSRRNRRRENGMDLNPLNSQPTSTPAKSCGQPDMPTSAATSLPKGLRSPSFDSDEYELSGDSDCHKTTSAVKPGDATSKDYCQVREGDGMLASVLKLEKAPFIRHKSLSVDNGEFSYIPDISEQRKIPNISDSRAKGSRERKKTERMDSSRSARHASPKAAWGAV